MQLSDLIVKFNLDGETGVLHENLVMSFTEDDGETWVRTVPKGFKTDFASIPKAVRSLIPQLGKWTAPAVCHDYHYWIGMPQKESDHIFLIMMKEAGAGWFKRNVIYQAVARFGGFAWRKHRKQGHCKENAIQGS